MDGDGRTRGRGGGAVKDILKIVVAIFLVIIAFKVLKGILSIAVTLAALGLIVWGGMKLLDNSNTKRIE